VLDRATLLTHLEALGWKARPHDEGTYKSSHTTDEGELNIFVRLQKNWLIASVVPFLPTKGQNSFELARWLLRVNRDMYQAKFAYDDDGDVVLTLELPTESLDASEIRGALTTLLEQAVAHRKTLRLASGVTA
jgi:hypothetical protein